jgi:2-polyprenyl-3-methyl-5-hydroxy-6-metoxy-1,4-benzoquinol methylase
MTAARASGDRTEQWRESYARVSKDFLRDPQDTNRARLALLGVAALPRDIPILDAGAGDGNLHSTLAAEGFSRIWGFEYQHELARLHPQRSRIVIASATDIPYATGSMAAVVVMDVLHHLTQAQLPRALAEFRRVLRPDGQLFVCEPAGTLLRRALTILLMSPLSGVSRFSRDKRAMVEAERETLEPWLEAEPGLPDRVAAGGFRVESFRRYWLHHYGRFRAV